MIWDCDKVLPRGALPVTVVLQPSFIDTLLPCLRQLVPFRQPKRFKQRLVPKAYRTFVANRVLCVGDNYQQRKPIKPKLVDEVQLAKTEKAASARKPKAVRPKASEE